MDTNPRVPPLIPGDGITHNEAKTREVAEAYVGGRLAQPDSEAFEEHFFACAECWDDVQALQQFRDGVRDAARSGELESAPPATHWKWAFAAAAVFLIGFASWTMLWQIPRLEAQLAAARNIPAPAQVLIAQAQPNLPLLLLEASRADAVNTLTLPTAARQLAIWVDAPTSAPRPFRLEILGNANQTVESLAALEPNPHGALTAALPAEKLPPGRYTARLFGANGVLAGEYKFEIKR